MPVQISEVESYDSAVFGPAAGDVRNAASVRQIASPLAARTLWLWKRLQSVIGTFAPTGSNAPVAVAVDSTTDVFTCAGHGLSDTDPVRFFPATGAVLPTPLTTAVTYFVVSSTTDTFKVSLTSGGAAVNITDNGTASYYVGDVSLCYFATLSAALNHFTGNIEVDGTSQLDGNVTMSSALNVSGITTLGQVIIGNQIAQTETAISASATTYTYPAAGGTGAVIAKSWNGAGGVLAVTLADIASGSARRDEVNFYFHPTASTHDLVILQSDGNPANGLIITNGAAWVRVRWDGTRYRLAGWASEGAVTIGI